MKKLKIIKKGNKILFQKKILLILIEICRKNLKRENNLIREKIIIFHTLSSTQLFLISLTISKINANLFF
jgi:hypothetical protein